MTDYLSDRVRVMTATPARRGTGRPPTGLALRGPMAAVLAGQSMLGFGLTVLGATVCAVVIVALLTHGLLAGRLDEEGGTRPALDPLPDALCAVMLVALAGLLDAARPLGAGQPVANALVVAASMLVAVALVMRPAPLRTLRSSVRVSWRQVAVGLAGIPCGVVVATLVRPAAVARPSLSPGLVGALVVAGILGASAELVFRGVVQTALGRALGSRGVVAAAALSAGAAAVSGSVALAASAGVVGLTLGWWVERTDSLWGAAVAHGLLYMTLVLSAGIG